MHLSPYHLPIHPHNAGNQSNARCKPVAIIIAATMNSNRRKQTASKVLRQNSQRSVFLPLVHLSQLGQTWYWSKLPPEIHKRRLGRRVSKIGRLPLPRRSRRGGPRRLTFASGDPTCLYRPMCQPRKETKKLTLPTMRCHCPLLPRLAYLNASSHSDLMLMNFSPCRWFLFSKSLISLVLESLSSSRLAMVSPRPPTAMPAPIIPNPNPIVSPRANINATSTIPLQSASWLRGLDLASRGVR